jgi:hypothetical protein
MDLETARLIAFALWAEAYSGTAGKSPDDVVGAWEKLGQATRIEDVHQFLGADLGFKLDNYLSIWGTAAEEEPPPTVREEIEAVEQPKEPVADQPVPKKKKTRR